MKIRPNLIGWAIGVACGLFAGKAFLSESRVDKNDLNEPLTGEDVGLV